MSSPVPAILGVLVIAALIWNFAGEKKPVKTTTQRRENTLLIINKTDHTIEIVGHAGSFVTVNDKPVDCQGFVWNIPANTRFTPKLNEKGQVDWYNLRCSVRVSWGQSGEVNVFGYDRDIPHSGQLVIDNAFLSRITDGNTGGGDTGNRGGWNDRGVTPPKQPHCYKCANKGSYTCPACFGNGKTGAQRVFPKPGVIERCERCNGHGFIQCQHP